MEHAVEEPGFRAAVRLGQDTCKEFGLSRCPSLLNAADVARTFADLGRMDREVLIAATLDCKCRLVHWNLLSVGCADRVTMRLGDAFHGAIRFSARGVILVHNHPSGSLRVSKEDLVLTQSVLEAGQLLGYTLLDHVILSRHGFRSIMKVPRRQPSTYSLAKADPECVEAAERPRGLKRMQACGRG